MGKRERRRAEALKQKARIKGLLVRSGTFHNYWHCPYDGSYNEIYDKKIIGRAKNHHPFEERKYMIRDGYRNSIPKVREARADLSDGDGPS